MTLDAGTRLRPEPLVGRAPRTTPARTVVLLAALTMLLRLPFLGSPISSDEGGFLLVARHWHEGGGSLYGAHWVDRPPLLIALFGLGDLLGGLTGLRLLGCAAAGVTVLGVALATQWTAGHRAATWSAGLCCALLATPALGGLEVNGELLAAPFVAFGIALVVRACGPNRTAGSAWMAALAGVSAVAAVMVKQNFVDVAVFGVVYVLACLQRRVLPPARALALGLAFGAGALACLVTVLGAAATRGTSPRGVLFAMYPFRLRANAVIAHAPLGDRLHHLEILTGAWAVSTAPLVLVLLIVLLVRRRVEGASVPLALAATALAAYDVLSVAAGGSYWMHYLVQLAPVTALAGGLVVSARPRLGRGAVLLVASVASVTWCVGLGHWTDAAGEVAGGAIASVSEPGDTVVSAMGSADIVEAGGFRSPYPYLWSLPAHVLDPNLTRLDAVMRGPDAPTWVVVRGPQTLALLDAHGAGKVLGSDYHRVGQVCGRSVYLRDDVSRSAPSATDCRRPLSTWFTDPPEIGAP